MHPFTVRAWGTARDAKLREGLVAYLRIQLRLGAIQVSEAEGRPRASICTTLFVVHLNAP